jgi:aspartate/tyrosine/aromatic aminotransferase
VGEVTGGSDATSGAANSTAAYEPREHKAVNVTISARRWNVYVTIRDHNGVLIEEYVASADRGITYGDGVFFGTRAEYEDAMQDA